MSYGYFQSITMVTLCPFCYCRSLEKIAYKECLQQCVAVDVGVVGTFRMCLELDDKAGLYTNGLW